MVDRLEGAGLVIDEKLDMIIEHLRKQEENAARLELRLAEYSENMAEVRTQKRKNQSPVLLVSRPIYSRPRTNKRTSWFCVLSRLWIERSCSRKTFLEP